MQALPIVSGILWNALVYLNGELAAEKNEPRYKWWLYSLILGPLASGLILARPETPRPHDPDKSQPN